MHIKNHEFKARVENLASYEEKLLTLNPDFKGTDRQSDTYYYVSSGRLKLREGNIENALICYDRDDIAGSKQSDVILYRHSPDQALKTILEKQFGIRNIVKKTRKIYFIANVKFHFDSVDGLGTFIEAEAIDDKDQFTPEQLREQCDKYLKFFNITKDQLVDKSYSDLLEACN